MDWHLTREDSYGRGRRRALPDRRAASTASPGATSTFIEVERPRRIVERRPRRQVQPHPDAAASTTLEPGSGGGTRVEFTLRDRAEAAHRPAPGGASAPARWFKRKLAQGAAPPARDPRGGPRPRRARHGRRRARSLLRIAVRADRIRPPALRRLVSLDRSSPLAAVAARRLRQQGGDHHARRDRGHLPRRRRPQVPGPDLAPAQPADVEDRDYLIGLPAEPAARPTDEVVVRRLHAGRERRRDKPRAGRRHSRSRDTQGNVFQPVRARPRRTSFAYRAGDARGRRPGPACRTPPRPGNGPIQGSLLLFKVRRASLAEPPARAPHHAPDGARRSRDRRPRRLAPERARLEPAGPRARPAPRSSPPAPGPTSSTPTATRGAPSSRREGREPGVGVGRVVGLVLRAGSASGFSGRAAQPRGRAQLGGAGLARDRARRGSPRACRCRRGTTARISRSTVRAATRGGVARVRRRAAGRGVGVERQARAAAAQADRRRDDRHLQRVASTLPWPIAVEPTARSSPISSAARDRARRRAGDAGRRG